MADRDNWTSTVSSGALLASSAFICFSFQQRRTLHFIIFVIPKVFWAWHLPSGRQRKKSCRSQHWETVWRQQRSRSHLSGSSKLGFSWVREGRVWTLSPCLILFLTGGKTDLIVKCSLWGGRMLYLYSQSAVTVTPGVELPLNNAVI